MSSNDWKFDTLVIHGAQTPEQWKHTSLVPIYQSASHRFDTAEELSEVFDATTSTLEEGAVQ